MLTFPNDKAIAACDGPCAYSNWITELEKTAFQEQVGHTVRMTYGMSIINTLFEKKRLPLPKIF
jgi:hypothetical protein